jgi:signal transduction histidine kinase
MNKLSVEVNEIAKDLNSLATHPVLTNSTAPLNDQINLLQRHLNFSNSEYLAVSVYDRNGTAIIDTSDKSPYGNALQEEFFKQALAGGPYFDKNPDEIAFNQTGFHFSAPIYDANKVIKSIMDLEVSISFIDNIVNNTLFQNDIENGSLNFTSRLIHNDGSVIYVASQENGRHDQNGQPNLKIPLPKAPITEYDKRRSQNSIMIVVPESENANGYRSDGNWTLLIEGNLAPIMSDYNKTVNGFLISSTMILLIAITVTIISVKKIISPITYLKNSALELSKGNFGKEIVVGGSNEVKDLSISLEAMRRNIENSKKNLIRKIRERTKDLERANEELRTKEIQVKSINNELEISNRAREEFLSMVSQELKNPITPMKHSIEMMQKENKSDLDNFNRKALIIISRNISKLETIIDDIFTLYKLELNSPPIKKEVTNLVDLVEKNISRLSPLMENKNIRFNSIVNASGCVLCDPVRVSQVLFHLVSNAVDHVAEQGGEITIRVDEDAEIPSKMSRDDNVNKHRKSVIFTVQDNGIWIQPENAKGLPNKLCQIDLSLVRKIGGTGLGLIICKGILESQGGEIWIDLSYRDGASFKFSLDAV